MDYTTGFPGDSDLAAQAISAIHQGADPDAVRDLFLKVAEQRGADPSKISVDFLNDNPTAKASSDTKITPATKRAYADVVQGNQSDLDVADNTVGRERGIVGLLAPQKQKNSPIGGNFDDVESGGDSTGYRRPGFVESAARSANTAWAKTAGLLAPISYVGAAGSALATGDNAPSYSEFLQQTRDVQKDMAPKVGEKYGLSEQAGNLTGQLAVELPQFIGVTKAARAAEAGVDGATDAMKTLWTKLIDNSAGGATPAMAEATNVYKDEKDAGASEIEAIAKAAKAGVVKDAMFVAPASVEGKLATRVASGMGINTALGSAQEYADTGKITPEQIALSAATGGVFGALGEGERVSPKFPKPKTEESPIPETNDPAFEAGKDAVDSGEFDFDAAMQRQKAAIADRTEPTQQDMFTKTGESTLQGDMFGEPVEAKTAEARRAAASRLPARSDEEQAGLEKNYIQDQQDKLNQQPDVGTEPKSRAELWDVGAAGIVEDKLAQAGDIMPQTRNPVTNRFEPKRFSPANAAMADAFEQAGVRRGLGLKDESLFPDIRNQNTQEGGEGGTFEPSQNKTVDQTAEQGSLDLGQEDLFNQAAPARKEAGMSPYAQRKARLAQETQVEAAKATTDKAESAPKRPTRKQVFDQRTQAYQIQIGAAERMGNEKGAAELKAKLASHLATEKGQTGEYKTARQAESSAVDLRAAIDAAQLHPLERETMKATLSSDYFKNGAIPDHWKAGVTNGSLKFGDVLHDLASGKVSAHPMVKEFAQYLYAMGRKLGGLDSTFKHFDESDPVHNAYLTKKALEGKTPGAAYYNSVDNTTRMDPKYMSMHDFMHEGSHAIVSRAIEAGRLGKLTGEAAVAFNRLNRLFEATRDLPKTTSADRAAAHHEQYGFKNIHEFMAELYGNPAFRDHLKSIPFKDVEASVPAESPRRSSFARVKSVYQAVVGTLGKLLGMSPKLTNMLDASLATGHEFFQKVKPEETKNAFSKPLENTRADEELQGPRSPGWKWTKLFLAPKGIEPLVTLADRTREGVTAHGYVEAAQAANRMRKVTTEANKADINAALDGDAGALSRLTGKAGDVVKNEMAKNADRVIEFAKEVQANPKASDKEKAAVVDLLSRAAVIKGRITKASVLPKTIFGASFMKQKWDMAQKAEAKLAKGETLNPTEQNAKTQLDDLRDSLEQTWFPKDLTSAKTPELEKLYWYHVGENPDGMNLKGEAKKNAMIAQIGQSIQDTVNKAGAVDNLAKSAMDLTDKNDRMRQYYRALRKKAELGAEVPDALMKVWEQVDEPAARIASNIVAQRSATAETRALNQLRSQGLGKIFTEQKGTAGYTHQLTGSRYGALRNLWTTPDVAGVINGAFGRNYLFTKLLDGMVADPTTRHWPMLAAAETLKGWSSATQYWKMYNVMGKVGRYVLNAAGSFSQAMSNGNASGDAWRKGIMTAIESLGISAKKSMSPMLADMFKYHQIEYSWIQELKGTENGNIISSILKRAAASNDLAGAFYEARRKAQLSVQVAKELYGIQDWWTKAANWHQKLDVWTDHAVRTESDLQAMSQKYGADAVQKALMGYDKSVPDIRMKMAPEDRTTIDKQAERVKQFVSKRNNDTNITPSLSFPAVRAAEKLAGAFLTYFAEIPRTLGMSAKYGFEDAFRGAWTKDPKIFQHGMDQILGTAIAVYGISSFGGAMYSAGANMLGLSSQTLTDEDPRKRYADSDPYLATMSPMVLKDPEHPEAGEYIVDQGAVDPYGPMTVPLWKAVSAMQKSQAGDRDGAKQDLEMAYKSFWGMIDRNPVLAATRKIMNGATPRMAQTNPDEYNHIKKSMTDRNMTSQQANAVILMMETASLGSFKDWVAGAGVAQKSPALGTATKAGVGVQPFNTANDISTYIGGKTVADIGTAKKAYTDLMKQDYTSSPERLESGFKDALKDIAEPYANLEKAVQAAKAQGTSDEEVVARLKFAGVGKRLIYTLLDNKPMTILQMMADLKNDLKKDIASNYTDPKKRDEAVDRFVYNNEQLISLIQKYQDVPIEEIK